MPLFQMVITTAVAVLALFALKIVDVFFPTPKANGPMYFWLYPTDFLFLIYCLIRPKRWSVLGPFVVLVMLFVGTASGIYFKTTPWFEAQKLKVFASRYDECRISAIPINEKTAVKLCDNYDRVGYFDGIAYDSSDEIAQPPRMRSISWWKAAFRQKPGGILVEFPFTVFSLGNHYYYVSLDDQSRSPVVPTPDEPGFKFN